MKKIIAGLFALGCLTTAQTSHAEDALYDVPPPPDAVFVRWLAGAEAVANAGDIFGYSIPSDIELSSDYLAISASLLGDAVPGSYLSAMPDAQGDITWVTEPARADRSKVYLVLSSCAGTSAQLVVPGPGLIVAETPAGPAVDIRGVNPVDTPLAVMSEGVNLATFDLSLTRGQNLTFLACNGTASLIENAVSTIRLSVRDGQ